MPASAMTLTALIGAMLASPREGLCAGTTSTATPTRGSRRRTQADVRFPVGAERVRLAIEGVAPAMQRGLARSSTSAAAAASSASTRRNLGWRAVGVDNAPGMIEEARAARSEPRRRVARRGVRRVGAADGEFDAVTAMGLIEYLPDDDGLFAEAARLLRPGGRFAVSCRNRLYNLQSVNDYTARGARRGGGAAARRSCATSSRARDPDELHALAESLAEAADELEARGRGRPRDAAAGAARPPPCVPARAPAAHAARPRAGSGAHRVRAASSCSRSIRIRSRPRSSALAPRAYNRLARRVAALARALARGPRVLDGVRRRLRASLKC